MDPLPISRPLDAEGAAVALACRFPTGALAQECGNTAPASTAGSAASRPAAAQGISSRCHRLRPQRRQLRPRCDPARPRPEVLQAELRGILRAPASTTPSSRRGASLMPRMRATLRTRREALRRPPGNPHRHLGPGDALRLRHQLHASPSSVRWQRWPTTAAARRSSPASCSTAVRIIQRGDMTASGNARRLGRRDRADPVPAHALRQVRGRLRRRRPPRPRAQRAGHHGLHGELPQRPRWQAGQSWEPGSANYAVLKRLEPRRGLPAHHLGDGHEAARRRAGRRPAAPDAH